MQNKVKEKIRGKVRKEKEEEKIRKKLEKMSGKKWENFENICCPVVHGCSVIIQRYQHSENL